MRTAVVFIPKCRRKTLYVQLRQYLGEVFRKLSEQKESRIEEWHLMLSMPVEIRSYLPMCRLTADPRDGVPDCPGSP